MGFKARGRLLRHQFESSILGNCRGLWVQAGSSEARPEGVLLFLDGEHYIDDIGAVEIVDALQGQARLAGLLPVYVSHIDYPTRWRESFCNDDFATFLAVELLPWLIDRFDVSGDQPNALIGVSLTGLAAAHAGLQHPRALSRVLSQSGSFWWQGGTLVDEVSRRPGSDLTLYLSVGNHETDENIDHGNGLFQVESQLSSNRRMRDALASKGYQCTYCEFDGGHDFASFRRNLPDLLASLE